MYGRHSETHPSSRHLPQKSECGYQGNGTTPCYTEYIKWIPYNPDDVAFSLIEVLSTRVWKSFFNLSNTYDVKQHDIIRIAKVKERLPYSCGQHLYQGKLYHLGYTESTLCILYNKELFHSLGIRIPTSAEDAWSWDEFLNVCHTIQTKTSFPYPLLMDSGRGLSPKSGEWNSYAGLPFIVQNNGSFFNDTLTATSGYINSPASVAAMNWLGELFHKYHYTHVEDLSARFS